MDIEFLLVKTLLNGGLCHIYVNYGGGFTRCVDGSRVYFWWWVYSQCLTLHVISIV